MGWDGGLGLQLIKKHLLVPALAAAKPFLSSAQPNTHFQLKLSY